MSLRETGFRKETSKFIHLPSVGSPFSGTSDKDMHFFPQQPKGPDLAHPTLWSLKQISACTAVPGVGGARGSRATERKAHGGALLGRADAPFPASDPSS